jgi:succinyl-CoA synthetase alpha subunit
MYIDLLRRFEEDPETEAIIVIGEIGGTAEQDTARWAKDNVKKPMVGFIAGQTAPPGRRMGHAGAIISGGEGTAAEKMRVMEECGILVSKSPADMGTTMVEALKRG